MKQLILGVLFVFSTILNAQYATNSTISFNTSSGLNYDTKEALKDTYYQMHNKKYHLFNLIDENEKNKYPHNKLISLARQRAEIIRNYFIENEQVLPANIKIQYGGTYPTLSLHKPQALYSASGEISLDDNEKQCYNYNSTIENSFYSNNGWQFIFPSYAFETLDGEPVNSQNVSICLWEFTDKKSLIYSGLTTHSGDRMLETGGSFFIEAKLNGTPLRIKQGEKYLVKIPAEILKDNMFTYYGNTKDGIIDWEIDKREPVLTNGNATTQTVYIEDEWGDPIVSEEDFYESEGDNTLYELSAGKLGWINCDRFYDAKNTAPLVVKVDSKDPVVVRLVFRNINSVLPCYATSNHKDVYEAKGIPAGEKVLVLAYSVKNDNAILGYQEVIIGEDKSASIKLNNLSKARFKGAVSELLSY